MNQEYLSSALKQFQYYKVLGEKAISQVAEDKLNFVTDTNNNSISIIVHHLYGNMKSRWVDFLTTDGEKPTRNRDSEFEDIVYTRDELLKLWEEGWSYLFSALNGLTPDDYSKTVYIRNQGHTIVDAVNRQLCHYSYHVGQIVLLSKLYCSESWQSLSIPKGQSSSYNANKFSQEKKQQHFTDEYIPKNK